MKISGDSVHLGEAGDCWKPRRPPKGQRTNSRLEALMLDSGGGPAAQGAQETYSERLSSVALWGGTTANVPVLVSPSVQTNGAIFPGLSLHPTQSNLKLL